MLLQRKMSGFKSIASLRWSYRRFTVWLCPIFFKY